MSLSQLPPSLRARGVTAVLGPTNTGKTHLAIERMLGHGAGIIGLPLRLLAREIYNKLVERVGAGKVALITGEEKIKPDGARYWVSTVEAMPQDIELPFLALDEIQIAADLERGHVFTDRLLNRRGTAETLLLGAATMRPILEKLIPGVAVISRPRLSNLSFSGEKKLTRLPRRSAIVAFSADEVYAIAELVRRQRGGAAVVLGALSPRTRNAQVALYQNGDVDYLIATDAIGMGLNLDVDHVAFAGNRKFDGYQFRPLRPAEMGQIAGRAGRHLRDGTFGTTGRCDPFEPEIAQALERHSFEPIQVLQWRNPDLVFSSISALQESLSRGAAEAGLTRAPDADDVHALALAAQDDDVRRLAIGRDGVERLWDVAQLPDYRKTSFAAHAELVTSLYGFLMRQGTIPDDWLARQVALQDRTEGDIDTLSSRILHIRTWTYAANRPDWVKDPAHWQAVTRGIEDKLSDALHERLAQRFVDRRTSVLMRRLKENAMLETEITKAGHVIVEGQSVGTLHGFQFVPDPDSGAGDNGRALRAAAAKVLSGEIAARAQKFSQAPDTDFALSLDGTVRWVGETVGKLAASEKILAPRIRLLADEQLTGADLESVQTRLDIWIASHVSRLLGPLLALEAAEEIQGLARGLAFRLVEDLGILDRAKVAADVKAIDQDQRANLRKLGVRFGAYHIYVPALMKPAPRTLAVQLWTLKQANVDPTGLDDIHHLAASGRTSIPANPQVDRNLYRLIGYRVCGDRAVRVDILERLADLIRPAIAYRPGISVGEPPPGTADGDGFVVTSQMTSLVGCSGADFATILKGLSYRLERRKGPPITQEIRLPAATAPAEPARAAADQPSSEASEELDEAATAAADSDAVPPSPPQSPESAAVAGDPPPSPSSAAAMVASAPAGEPQSAQPDLEQPALLQENVPASTEELPKPVEDGVAASPETDTLIEIWRLSRFERTAHPPHRRPRHADRNPAAPSRAGLTAADGSLSRKDHSLDRKDARPSGARADQPVKNAGRVRPGGPDRRGKPAPDLHRSAPKAQGSNGRSWSSETNGGRSKLPDPNSPFAKLAALKEQMQGKPPQSE